MWSGQSGQLGQYILVPNHFKHLSLVKLNDSENSNSTANHSNIIAITSK